MHQFPFRPLSHFALPTLLLLGFCCLWPASSGLLAQELKPVTVEDVWRQYSFYARSAESIRWWPGDDRYYTRLEEGYLVRYATEEAQPVDTLLAPPNLLLPDGDTLAVESYRVAPEHQYVLLVSESQRVYRHSRREKCWVYHLQDKQLRPLFGDSLVMNPTFSPNGLMLAFNYRNNLYFQDLVSGKNTQITEDGVPNEILNGLPDWVYEEEFSFARAFEWAPNSKKLVYLRFDERAVPTVTLKLMGRDQLYPRLETFKYPKAGEQNSTVTAHTYNLDTDHHQELEVTQSTDYYLPRLGWTPDSRHAWVFRMNRHQSTLEVLLAEPEVGKAKLLLRETSGSYIDIVDHQIIFLEKENQFLWQSERDGYNHAYLYQYDPQDPRNADLLRQVTQGYWNVAELYGVDEENELLYYLSTENSPLERYLYRIRLDGKRRKQLTQPVGWHSISFSSNFRYYIDQHSNLHTPPTYKLYNADNRLLRTLEDNAELAERLRGFRLGRVEFLEIPIQDGAEYLNAFMIKPPDFDPDKRYPVLMYCYGGPGAQTVTNRYDAFNHFWFQYLAQQGYLVVSVDNRGTGGRSADFKKMTYKQLGKYEHLDQAAAARWLGSLAYVDNSRIGIWGWSFGGYLTALCLTKSPELFKAGISVAPVSSWRFYDTIYTERFLQTPQENPTGYDQNSPLNFAAGLKGKYLLVHGTADDNVHVQNAYTLANALIAAGKDFEQFMYPDRNHGIYGGNTRYHLYTKMSRFIRQNL